MFRRVWEGRASRWRSGVFSWTAVEKRWRSISKCEVITEIQKSICSKLKTDAGRHPSVIFAILLTKPFLTIASFSISFLAALSIAFIALAKPFLWVVLSSSL